MVMECGQCDCEPGLDKPRCFRSALVAIQREGVPVAITLRSHVERRYGLEACDSLGRVSGILNKLDSLQAQLGRDSGKGEACAGCVKPLSGNLDHIGGKLRGMDLSGAVGLAREMERGDFGSNRQACGDCAGMTIVQMADIAKALKGLENSIARVSITITEAGQ